MRTCISRLPQRLWVINIGWCKLQTAHFSSEEQEKPRIWTKEWTYLSQQKHLYIWWFPKIGGPPVLIHFELDGFSTVNQPAIGYNFNWWKPPYLRNSIVAIDNPRIVFDDQPPSSLEISNLYSHVCMTPEAANQESNLYSHLQEVMYSELIIIVFLFFVGFLTNYHYPIFYP